VPGVSKPEVLGTVLEHWVFMLGVAPGIPVFCDENSVSYRHVIVQHILTFKNLKFSCPRIVESLLDNLLINLYHL
jgi:hypothetical protein